MRVQVVTGSLALLLAGAAASDASGADRRSYVAGSYQIYVDGAPGVWVPSISGGGATSDVVVEKAGSTGSYPKKHAGAVKYEDITFGVGGPMEKVMHDWVKQTIASASMPRKGGYFVSVDASNKEHSRTTWTDGFISDVTFPELDASSKEAVRININVSPSSTRSTQTNAGKADAAAATQRSRGQALMGHNFRLTLSGLETMSRMVTRVEPMSVRLKTVQQAVGELRDYEKTAGQVDVSNLVFTVAESAAADLYRWHEDFVIKGNSDDSKEKTATLELLAADGKTVYKLNMRGVGIIKLTPDKASSESVRRVRAEAYVESVSLD